jgi:hypothetical protein
MMTKPSSGLQEARLLLALLLALLSSCTAVGPRASDGGGDLPHVQGAQRARLEADLTLLLGYRDPETPRLAEAILSKTDELSRIYRIQPPALWHNFLVNLGIRERGLCCHWTQDLLREIEALHLSKYHALWGVSRYGSWREHNSVVVTAVGQPFANGMVVDPWRTAGVPFWTSVQADSYDWIRHPGDKADAVIHCR